MFLRKTIVLFFAVVLFLIGCDKKETEDQLPKMLNVELAISPNKAQVNESIKFEAKVTYGDEMVTDADDVSFEIWRANKEGSEKFPVKYSKDGKYEYQKAFSEEGTYYVYAHVTAKGMHTMPKGEFVIGALNK